MIRRDFLHLAAAVQVAAIAPRASAASCDPMVELVAELFRLREYYGQIPDATGDGDSLEHVATYDLIARTEGEIEVCPITSRNGLVAYCRYLSKEAWAVGVDPEQFAKIIDWAAGGDA